MFCEYPASFAIVHGDGISTIKCDRTCRRFAVIYKSCQIHEEPLLEWMLQVEYLHKVFSHKGRQVDAYALFAGGRWNRPPDVEAFLREYILCDSESMRRRYCDLSQAVCCVEIEKATCL